MGIAVSHVLDVAAGGDLFEAGTSQRTGGVTLFKERVTGVVDLGGVPPLPAAESAPDRVEPDCGDSGMSSGNRIASQRKSIGDAGGGLLGAPGRDMVRRAHHAHS